MTPVVPAGASEYTIVKGDFSQEKIAKNSHVSVKASLGSESRHYANQVADRPEGQHTGADHTGGASGGWPPSGGGKRARPGSKFTR